MAIKGASQGCQNRNIRRSQSATRIFRIFDIDRYREVIRPQISDGNDVLELRTRVVIRTKEMVAAKLQ